MKISLLNDRDFCEVLRERWNKWQTHKRYYPNAVMWWTRYVKAQIRKLFADEGAARRQDRKRMENYYEATYVAIHDVTSADMLHVTSKDLKGKIIRLHYGPKQRLFLDSDEQDKQQDKPPTLYHLRRQRKRQQSRHICKVQDGDGNIYRSSRDNLKVFTEHLKHTFDIIKVEINAIHAILEGVEVQLPPEANMVLQTPI
jgi:hypothetical protein